MSQTTLQQPKASNLLSRPLLATDTNNVNDGPASLPAHIVDDISKLPKHTREQCGHLDVADHGIYALNLTPKSNPCKLHQQRVPPPTTAPTSSTPRKRNPPPGRRHQPKRHTPSIIAQAHKKIENTPAAQTARTPLSTFGFVAQWLSEVGGPADLDPLMRHADQISPPFVA
ncbi:MAG: hypothetical protein Q9166_007287 [cf. Caloplaca sp. 2 TL-2023]